MQGFEFLPMKLHNGNAYFRQVLSEYDDVSIAVKAKLDEKRQKVKVLKKYQVSKSVIYNIFPFSYGNDSFVALLYSDATLEFYKDDDKLTSNLALRYGNFHFFGTNFTMSSDQGCILSSVYFDPEKYRNTESNQVFLDRVNISKLVFLGTTPTLSEILSLNTVDGIVAVPLYANSYMVVVTAAYGEKQEDPTKLIVNVIDTKLKRVVSEVCLDFGYWVKLVSISPDGRFLFTGSMNRQSFWVIPLQNPKKIYTGNVEMYIREVLWYGGQLITCSYVNREGKIMVFNLPLEE